MCPERAEGDDALRGKGRRHGSNRYDWLPAERGVYVICFRLLGPVKVLSRDGKELASVGPGLIVYVGSAGGRGGIRARVSRHLSGPTRRWWHIDSITSSGLARALFVYYEVGGHGPQFEDELARYLSRSAALTPLGRLGATDSNEPHMFKCSDLEGVLRALSLRKGTLVRVSEG